MPYPVLVHGIVSWCIARRSSTYYRVRAVALQVSSAYSSRAGVALGKAPLLMTNGTVSTCDAFFLDPGRRKQLCQQPEGHRQMPG